MQDHERLRGGLYYIQNIPRDENWKVLKSVLQKFVPPVKVTTNRSVTILYFISYDILPI